MDKSIFDIMRILKKRWKIILAFTLAISVGIFLMTIIFIKPQYEATTKMFIGKDTNLSEGYDSNDINLYQQLSKTYSELIESRNTIISAIELAGIDKSPEEVSKNLNVFSMEGTQIIKISYRSEDPEDTFNFINSISDEFIQRATYLIPNVNIQVLENAIYPEKSVSPNIPLTIVISVFMGMIIGIGVSTLFEMIDSTYKGKDQLEEEFRIPVIGEIPKFREDKKS